MKKIFGSLRTLSYFISFLFFSNGHCSFAMQLGEKQSKDFIKSFLTCYECGPEGRYTHEYHPFLLSWTADSLHQLEKRLKGESLDLNGRIVIMGFEENAVPEYYCNYSVSKISDEASHKSSAGWSLRLHNRFGFMTGYLFQDVENLKKINPDIACNHTDSDKVLLFDNRAHIFKEHAFGQALPLMDEMRQRIAQCINSGNIKQSINHLETFWSTLYKQAFKVGSKQIVGTQDVLFSIEYARYLKNSPQQIKHFFVGPDITYPIEVTLNHNAYATRHAQNFVKNFVPQLKPLDDKKTVYIFCSFVDGVGKSTMLGNIKNWMKFGDDTNKYEHVDNSSSQLATLFQFKDKVFIADLPAQMSHFTYKPDGYVFAEAKAQCNASFLSTLENIIKTSGPQLKQTWQTTLDQVKCIIKQQGIFAPQICSTANCDLFYARNVLLLKQEKTNEWYPFKHEGRWYLFKENKPLEFRVLIPLSDVKSEGLKNIQADQMFFTDGIRMPFAYNYFVDDLIKQIKNQNIEKVVFVDFLSMYPRSSRENVRINYLLQQMALLDESFDMLHSFYRNFVDGGHLLYSLMHPSQKQGINNALYLETLIRLILFDILNKNTQASLDGISTQQLTTILNETIRSLAGPCKQYAKDCVTEKIDLETKNFENLFGLSKGFVHGWHFSGSRVARFSQLICDFFQQKTIGLPSRALYEYPHKIVFPESTQPSDGYGHYDALTNSNQKMELFYTFDKKSKDKSVFGPCTRALRSCYFASICNLFSSPNTFDNRIQLDKPFLNIAPLLLIPGPNGRLHVARHHVLPYANEELEPLLQTLYMPFGAYVRNNSAYVKHESLLCRGDWSCKNARQGLLGFGYVSDDSSSSIDTDSDKLDMVANVLQRYQKEFGADRAMPVSLLLKRLRSHEQFNESDNVWDNVMNAIAKGIKKDNKYKGLHSIGRSEKKASQHTRFEQGGRLCTHLKVGNEHFASIARIVIRLLATLEMVIKDPESDIVIRYGNRHDFKAAIILFEKFLLPYFLGLAFNKDLFEDYDAVQPYPTWEFWDDLAYED